MVYLVVVVVVSVVGIGVVLLRRRGPRTMSASIDGFARARDAISPQSGGRVPRPEPHVLRRDQRRRHQAGIGD